MTAEVTELVGSEAYLYFDFEGRSCVARMPNTAIHKGGERVKLYIDLHGIHLFDAETELRINEELRIKN